MVQPWITPTHPIPSMIIFTCRTFIIVVRNVHCLGKHYSLIYLLYLIPNYIKVATVIHISFLPWTFLTEEKNTGMQRNLFFVLSASG